MKMSLSRWKLWSGFGIGLLLMAWSPLPVVFAAAGDLDPGFGSGGYTMTNFAAGNNDEARAIAVQADGKIVVAGTTRAASSGTPNTPQLLQLLTTDVAVARYNPDGSLDLSFGPNGTGQVVTALASSHNERVAGVAIVKDNKILVAGFTRTNAGSDLFVLRYLPNGQLDTGFGTNSSAYVVSNFQLFDGALAMAVQKNGSIVLVGAVREQVDPRLAVFRLLADGSPDTSFGTNGVLLHPNTTDTSMGTSVSLLSNDKILVGGALFASSQNTPLLMRVDKDGNFDTGFGPNQDGIVPVSANVDGSIQALGVQGGGDIIAAIGRPTGGHSFQLVRHTANGTFDAGFGIGGVSETPQPIGLTEHAYALRILEDNKIVVAGTVKKSSGAEKLKPSGLYFSTKFLDSILHKKDETSRKLVVVKRPPGTSLKPSKVFEIFPLPSESGPPLLKRIEDIGFAVVRYLPTGHLDAAFGSNGIAQTSNVLESGRPAALALQDDGNLVVSGMVGNGFDRDFVLVRYQNSAL